MGGARTDSLPDMSADCLENVGASMSQKPMGLHGFTDSGVEGRRYVAV
jgi:hypothetical protein